MMRNVYLQGELGTKFGNKFTVHASSTAEILKCINANRPGFREFLLDCVDKEIDLSIKCHEEEITADTLNIPLKKGDVTICMVPSGSKKAFKIILAVIIAIYAPQTLFFQTIAANLAIQGIAELTAPDPSIDKSDGDAAENYLFSGAQSVSKQNDPVPVLYGELRVPGRIADFDVRNEAKLNPSVIIDGKGNISVVDVSKKYSGTGE